MSFFRRLINYRKRLVVLFLLFAGLSASAQSLVSCPARVCVLEINNQKFQCSYGRAGLSDNKKEGDGTTPIGKFYLREVFYRPDRINRQELQTTLPITALQRNDAWCDDVNSPNYNRLIKLPFKGAYEALWRKDNLYDLVVVVGYNDQPPIKGKGSAIFLHISDANYKPTGGCLAFSRQHLLEILKYVKPGSIISIEANAIKIDDKQINAA